TSITVSSRSSTKRFTNGWPRRAVTFQSMSRTSSPGTYGRTSSNSTPRPLNTLSVPPENRSSTRRRLRISRRRTFLSRAWVAIGLDPLGDPHLLQDPACDFLAVDALGLGLVRDLDAVAEHVERDGLHVVGQHVRPGTQHRERLRAAHHEQRRTRARAVHD